MAISDFDWTSDWEPVFLIFPRIAISGRWVWLRAFRRRYVDWSFYIPETYWAYGDLFDTLK